MNKKTGLVLSGGGSKGAFQAGVLNQLEKKGFIPDIIYGTSVGALNASVFSFKNSSILLNTWRSIKKRSDILSFNYRMFFLMADGIYSTTPLRKKFIDRLMTGTPKYQVKVCRVNLVTSATEYVSNYEVSNKDFRDATHDSSIIPMAMIPRDIYIDGGVREVIPLAKAIRDGCTDITIILCNPWSLNAFDRWDYKSKNRFLRFLFIALRSVNDIMNTEVKWNDLYSVLSKIKEHEIKVTVYKPLNFLYETLEFNPKKIKDAIQQGEVATSVDIFDLFKSETINAYN